MVSDGGATPALPPWSRKELYDYSFSALRGDPTTRISDVAAALAAGGRAVSTGLLSSAFALANVNAGRLATAVTMATGRVLPLGWYDEAMFRLQHNFRVDFIVKFRDPRTNDTFERTYRIGSSRSRSWDEWLDAGYDAAVEGEEKYDAENVDVYVVGQWRR